MARNTRAKKQPEAPKVDIGAEIFASLRDLEKIKGIPVEYMVERLKQALTNAYRKDREDLSLSSGMTYHILRYLHELVFPFDITGR